MKLEYVRTDRNGTKYYNDWTCPRCGGAGQADKWERTGRTCYECGGTGKRVKPLIVKEYTEEHAAKLEARRAERQAKYEAEHADEIAAAKAEQEKREARWREEVKARIYRDYGIGKDGIGYIHTGDTYGARNELKANGGKWLFRVWICPVEVKAEGVSAKRVDLNECHITAERGVASSIADYIFDAVREVRE